MSKHTPGCWGTSYDGHGGICVDDATGRQIGFVSRRKEQEANASLIAAAPDLLEALQGMCSVWRTVCNSKGWDPDHMSQHVKASAAIAKATGEA